MQYSIVHDFVVSACKDRSVLYIGAGDGSGHLAESALATSQVASSWRGINLTPIYEAVDKVWIVDLNRPFVLPDFPVDLIVMTEVLEHLHSPVNTLRELIRRFPGCEFLGSVPNGMSIGRILMGGWSCFSYGNQDKDHFALYNRTTILNVMRAAGMKEVGLVPYQTRPLLRRVFGNNFSFAGGYILHGRF